MLGVSELEFAELQQLWRCPERAGGAFPALCVPALYIPAPYIPTLYIPSPYIDHFTTQPFTSRPSPLHPSFYTPALYIHPFTSHPLTSQPLTYIPLKSSPLPPIPLHPSPLPPSLCLPSPAVPTCVPLLAQGRCQEERSLAGDGESLREGCASGPVSSERGQPAQLSARCVGPRAGRWLGPRGGGAAGMLRRGWQRLNGAGTELPRGMAVSQARFCSFPWHQKQSTFG